jgi:Arc/MetJ-type ribon-helix-helix transcriptional regulator
MPEIRFSIPDKLNDRIQEAADELGVDKSDYIRSLILNDLREKGVRKNE